MSDDGNGKPPSWDDLVNQVQGALEGLNLNSPENQALFVDGLKEVMDSLDGMGISLGVPPFGSPPQTKPDMQVFEGGKSAPAAEPVAPQSPDKSADKSTAKKAETPAQKKSKKANRPDLKVAPPEQETEDKENPSSPLPKGLPPLPNLPPFSDFPANDPESIRTLFKVLRLGEDAQGGFSSGITPTGPQGKIHLAKGKGVFQNIFRGEEPRAYRIECTQGGLQIYLNGKPAEQILEGQTTDVEASVIRVQASNEKEAEGLYSRL
jgi:hypothetical protein